MVKIRGIEFLLQDLDRRQRPDPASKNRPLTKYASVQDSVTLSSETILTTLSTKPVYWAAAATSGQDLVWSSTVQGEWAGIRYRTEVLLDHPVAYFRLGEYGMFGKQADSTSVSVQNVNSETTTFGLYWGVVYGQSTGATVLGQPGALTADVNNAVSFDGSGRGQITSQSSALLADGVGYYSIEAWINTAALGSNAFLGKWGPSGSTDYIAVYIVASASTTTQIQHRRSVGGTLSVASGATSAISTGIWTHTVAVFDPLTASAYGVGGRVHVYVNGTDNPFGTNVDSTGALTFASSTPLQIGFVARTDDGALFGSGWNGLIDEVATYNYSLSPDRILAHYRAATDIV